MNILVLYDQYSTHTNTVFDHLQSFGHYSSHKHVYCHGQNPNARIEWDQFDALLIHYGLEIAFDRIPDKLKQKIAAFSGLKILFTQDEYDLTEKIRKTIEDLGIQTVFTCVPDAYRHEIYPPSRFPGVRFVSTLTGYVPPYGDATLTIPSIRDRETIVAYRGRALPFYYGDLGQEKLIIAQRMREECKERQLPCDIKWEEEHRIYGDNWLKFLVSAKATLGTESGCNVFDIDGSFRSEVKELLERAPSATYGEIRQAVFGSAAEKPIMNQISPRLFEAIFFKTALILFEGAYSGVLRPWDHYIPLRKDFSNLNEIFPLLADDTFLQRMVDNAHRDIIDSKRYTYEKFIREYDQVVDSCRFEPRKIDSYGHWGKDVTMHPLRSNPVPAAPPWLSMAWNAIPPFARKRLQHRAVWLWMKLRG